MARTVTLSAVRELVRNQLDLPTFTTTTFVTTAYVNSLINASLAQYYGLLMELYGENYYAATSTITTTANVDLSSLPTRCSKLCKTTAVAYMVSPRDSTVHICCQRRYDEVLFTVSDRGCGIGELAHSRGGQHGRVTVLSGRARGGRPARRGRVPAPCPDTASPGPGRGR